MPRVLEVTYVKSVIGNPEKRRRTLQSMGLLKLNQTVRLPDTPENRGNINAVRHLVTWQEVEEPENEA